MWCGTTAETWSSHLLSDQSIPKPRELDWSLPPAPTAQRVLAPILKAVLVDILTVIVVVQS